MISAVECCAAMALALTRVRDTDQIGLMRQLIINLRTGKSTEPIVIRFRKPKVRDKEDPFMDVVLIPAHFCPFCGKKLRIEEAEKSGVKDRSRSKSRRRPRNVSKESRKSN